MLKKHKPNWTQRCTLFQKQTSTLPAPLIAYLTQDTYIKNNVFVKNAQLHATAEPRVVALQKIPRAYSTTRTLTRILYLKSSFFLRKLSFIYP